MLWRHFPLVSSTVLSIGVASECNEAIYSYLGSVGTVNNVTADYICNFHQLGNATDFGTAASKGWALVRPYTCFTHPQEPLIHCCLLVSESLIFLMNLSYMTMPAYCLCVQNTVFHPSSFIDVSILTFDFIPSQCCWRNWYKVFSLLMSVARRTGTIESKDLVCLSAAGCVFNTDTTSCTHSQYLVVKCRKLDDLCVYVNVLEAYCANTYM